MLPRQEIEAGLPQFHGTTQYFRYQNWILLTDGARRVYGRMMAVMRPIVILGIDVWGTSCWTTADPDTRSHYSTVGPVGKGDPPLTRPARSCCE